MRRTTAPLVRLATRNSEIDHRHHVRTLAEGLDGKTGQRRLRVLFTSTPLAGHLFPLVPFARALADRGHEVAFATPPAGVPLATGAGFRTFAAGSGTSPMDLAREMGVDLAAIDGLAYSAFVQRHYFAGAPVLERTRALLALCADWCPSLVVREEGDLAGALAAERLGLPHAAVQVVVRGRSPARLAPLLEGLQDLRRALGLPPDPEGRELHRYLLLWPLLPALRHPEAVVPDTTRTVRPVPSGRSGDESPPPWLDELLQDGRPLVYATMGTSSPARSEEVYAVILRALADAPVSTVLTLGGGRDSAMLGQQPPRMRVERYVPQSLLLSHCHAVLFHGGSGTLIGALDHGLPMVVIPAVADQPQNAEAVAAFGVGIALSREDLTPDALRHAVLEVLHAPSYRARAQALARQLRSLPGPDIAATWLEQLAGAASARRRNAYRRGDRSGATDRHDAPLDSAAG